MVLHWLLGFCLFASLIIAENSILSPNGEDENALAVNALAVNALAVNALNANSVSVNSLTHNALAVNGLTLDTVQLAFNTFSPNETVLLQKVLPVCFCFGWKSNLECR